MTLICGRVCTKGEGKERLLRKRKRKRRREVNEHLTVSVSALWDSLPGNWNWAGWLGYAIASLEATTLCELRLQSPSPRNSAYSHTCHNIPPLW